MFCGVNIFIHKSHLDFKIELVTILVLIPVNPVMLTECRPIARRSVGQRTSCDVAGDQSQVAGVKHDVIHSQTLSFPVGHCCIYRQI